MRPLSRAIFAIAAASLTLSAVACTPVDYSEFYEVDGELTRVVLSVDEGSLEVVGSDREGVSVLRDVQGWEGNLSLETRVVDGVLFITASCEGVLRCQVDSVVEVPAGVEVEARVGRGSLTVSGLQGITDLSVGEGELVGWNLSPVYGTATVGVGSVELELVEEVPVSVAIGHGDVALLGETARVDVLGVGALR